MVLGVGMHILRVLLPPTKSPHNSTQGGALHKNEETIFGLFNEQGSVPTSAH